MTTQEMITQVQAAKEVKVTNIDFTWNEEAEQYYFDVALIADDKKWKDQQNLCADAICNTSYIDKVDETIIDKLIDLRLAKLSYFIGVPLDRTQANITIKLKD